MPGNYVLLETVSLTQSASSVVFDNIPQTGYTDLKIVASTRSTKSGGNPWDSLLLRFNGSSSGYSDKALGGNGATAFSFANAFPNYFFCGDVPDQGTTTNVFGSTEITIPNYTTSNQKLVSIDSVEENNSTTSQMDLVSGLWANTASITSLVFTLNTGSFVANSTFGLYGIAATGTTPVVAPKATGGNIVANDGTYWYHAFLSSGTFTPQTPITCDVLQIAGGGAGGAGQGGGGGAGGVSYLASQLLTSTNYACTVGAGAGGRSSSYRGANGSNSQFGSLTAAVGGGGGGNYDTNAFGADGGSGGGEAAGGNVATGTAGNGTSGQGNAGGQVTVYAPNYVGGGGGGAGAAGSSGGTSGGTGGVGTSTYSSWGATTTTGHNVSGTYYYAGGGGGAGEHAGSEAAGGSGGGASGANGTPAPALANTGGGGGAATYDNRAMAGSGGSGIIIIRYAMV